MSVNVNLAALGTIAGHLDTGTDGLERLAGGVPVKVDAGPMTAAIAALLAQVVDSAGNVSTSMSATAEAVRTCKAYYERTDADKTATFEAIQKAMKP